MYPWHERLNAWANDTGIRIDALGLVTLLGAEEMDRIVGRLVTSSYLDYLPLLGAFTVCGNRFTSKQSGFTLYNISDGVMTTELAGWFSRWLQTQDFDRVRSIVTWQAAHRPPQLKKFLVGFVLISFPIHAMLIALTVLAGDWWGFANVLSMVFSVIVRCVLVSENQAGINSNIRKAEEVAENYGYKQKLVNYQGAKAKLEELREKGQSTDGVKEPIAPKDQQETVKMIVMTDDSKAITIQAPRYLAKLVFATSPEAPRPRIYQTTQAIGWAAFAVHVISIGMSELYTQIVSVVLILSATILTAYKIGCEDSSIWQSIWESAHGEEDENQRYSCWVTSSLKATISTHSMDYCELQEVAEKYESLAAQLPDKASDTQLQESEKEPVVTDIEKRQPPRRTSTEPGRQDLYVRLDLTEAEEKWLTFWGMMPHDPEWMDRYLEKKRFHLQKKERKRMLAKSQHDFSAVRYTCNYEQRQR